MNINFEFSLDVQQMLQQEGFADKLIFSGESTFHVWDKIKLHNGRISGMSKGSPSSFILHQDGAAHRYLNDIYRFLNNMFPCW